jgi:cell fate regulator YaaT (PSP1 superfamily)
MAMKLVNVDYAFDGRKAVFYFIAENRVDFRDLVRDLANTLRVRVEMKQIGARDETKVTGGLGPCGRELCCSSWLRDFEAVTVKMAREQGLALNPSRLAGMCGRLKCCLRYEYATYVELKRALPNLGKRVQCVKGDGKVVRQNILKQTVLIQREEDGGVVEVTLEDLVASRPQ